MTSRGQRRPSHQNRSAQWSEWSEWAWDDKKGCYVSSREHNDGRREYRYGQSKSKASGAATSAEPRYAASATSDPSVLGSQLAEQPQSSLFDSPPTTDNYQVGAGYTAQAIDSAQSESQSPFHTSSANATSSGFENPYAASSGSFVPSEFGNPHLASTATSSQSRFANTYPATWGLAASSAAPGSYPPTSNIGTVQPEFPNRYGTSYANESVSGVAQGMARFTLSDQSTLNDQNFQAASLEGPQQNSKPAKKPSNMRRITTNNPSRESEPLHEDFRVHKSRNFTRGKVFKILWSEPYGSGGGGDLRGTTLDSEGTYISTSKYEQKAYHSIRRFVIIKAKKGHCICLPIMTYSKRGTAKPGVKPEDHTIIYTGSKAPKELKGEKKLHKKPIRVIGISKREKLAEQSRLNYNKVYTVEHDVKVRFIGKIDPNDKHTFCNDFKRTFEVDVDEDEDEAEDEDEDEVEAEAEVEDNQAHQHANAGFGEGPPTSETQYVS